MQENKVLHGGVLFGVATAFRSNGVLCVVLLLAHGGREMFRTLRDAKDETRAASRAPTGPGPGSRRKIAVSESTRNLAARMDRKEAEARKVFGGMAGVFGRAKSTKK